MTDPDDWRHWVEKAANDLLNINNNLAAVEIPWDTLCFHAQQAAEKMLKALLVARGEICPRTHDLSALLGRCQAAAYAVDALEESCRLLQPYAVLTRYPGSPFEPDEQEGRSAAAAARQVYEAVFQILVPVERQ
jgi:HEPN domain-containing protein